MVIARKINEEKIKWHPVLIAYGIVITLLVGGAFSYFCYIIYQFAPRENVLQTAINLNASHTAELIRYDGIDVNLSVFVDGKRVYNSPDLAVETTNEQIIWNKNGDTVILQVAEKRIFAYNVEQKRRISDAELSSIE